MSFRRVLLLVFLSSAPLLGAGLLLARPSTALVVLWLGGVLLLTFLVWNAAVRPLGELVGELGAVTPLDGERMARELRAETQRVREELAAVTELVEDLSAALGDGLVLVDADLKVRLVNPAARRFCGCDEVAPGTSLLEVLRDPGTVEAIRSAAGGKTPNPVAVEGRRGLWEIRAFPVRRGGAVALFTEVTLIQRSEELRRRFVQDLSHELRSPLAVLRTTVESLEGEADPEAAALLIRQVERITRLSEELHELATIESGQLQLRPEPLDLEELVSGVLNDARAPAERAGVELRAQLPDGLDLVADRRAVARILSNLVDNGIKYNRPGGWVEVRARAGDGTVHLVVADSGEGVPAPEVTAIFQRFYRVERGRTPGRGGLGLGLAIVKHLVQRLGGGLHTDSREGVGTTVDIELPAAPLATDSQP